MQQWREVNRERTEHYGGFIEDRIGLISVLDFVHYLLKSTIEAVRLFLRDSWVPEQVLQIACAQGAPWGIVSSRYLDLRSERSNRAPIVLANGVLMWCNVDAGA
jgi:hypothetical protein